MKVDENQSEDKGSNFNGHTIVIVIVVISLIVLSAGAIYIKDKIKMSIMATFYS